jgi:hypothetical protein
MEGIDFLPSMDVYDRTDASDFERALGIIAAG